MSFISLAEKVHYPDFEYTLAFRTILFHAESREISRKGQMVARSREWWPIWFGRVPTFESDADGIRYVREIRDNGDRMVTFSSCNKLLYVSVATTTTGHSQKWATDRVRQFRNNVWSKNFVPIYFSCQTVLWFIWVQLHTIWLQQLKRLNGAPSFWCTYGLLG